MSTEILPIAAIGAAASASPIADVVSMPANIASSVSGASFADLLARGVDHVEAKLAHANALADAFVLDDSIPVHQVTYALEEARLSLDLMLQVRGRLVDAYQQLMGMQL